jgi:hypothetical protein
MNRDQRRKAAKLGVEEVVNVTLGRCVMKDSEAAPQCYVCNKPAPAWEWPDDPTKFGHGFAIVNEKTVPVCRACWDCDAIARKFLNAPDLQFKWGSKLDEVLDALEDKTMSTTH